MTDYKPNHKVTALITHAKKWQPELAELRRVLLASPLTEEVKWRVPCYTFEGKNIIAINSMKDCVACGFFKGALIKDVHGILETPGENTQYGRYVRMTSIEQIKELEPILQAYIQEAIAIEMSGLTLPPRQTEDYPVAEEFQSRLEEDPTLAAAFEKLTPGRQRGYLLHFAAPKQSKTRAERVEKAIPRILAGKGPMDR